MESNKTYTDIITEYKTCKSITKIAKKLKVSEERVRRTLITEGLWTSRSAEPIIKLFGEGKTVTEIAEILMISEKTVQSYIPYSRGMYGGERSDTAQRSEEYRDRMRKAVEEMVNNDKAREIPEGKFPGKTDNKKSAEARMIKESVSDEDLMKELWDILAKEPDYVYQLRFDLTSGFLYGADESYDMSDGERAEFLKLARAKKGISRTVLVPGIMSLHAMHYMILSLFGWQNEHLHRYALPKEVFDILTCGEKIGEWLKLIGVLLRFPTGENSDLYWDDDYKPDQSVKSWLRSKYRKSYRNRCVTESMIASLSEIEECENRFLSPEGTRAKLKKDDTLNDLFHTVIFEGDFNTVLERLRVCDLLLGSAEAKPISLEEWKKEALAEKESCVTDIRQEILEDEEGKADLDEMLEGLKDWRELRSSVENALLYGRRKEVENHFGKKAEEVLREADEVIPLWEEDTFNVLDLYDPEISPFLNELYYLYDFGDDWCIRITCENRYKRQEESDSPEKNGKITNRAKKNKDGITTYRYFDEDENEIKGAERDRLAEVDVKKHPVCIASDGVSLVEDPGGIYGFYEMLKTLAGNDVEEKESLKQWARGLGWTGRISKPENML